MPKTFFLPLEDGLSLNCESQLSSHDINLIREALRTTVSKAITHLQKTYFGTIEIYELDFITYNGIFDHVKENLIWEAAISFIILDYYYSYKNLNRVSTRISNNPQLRKKFNEQIRNAIFRNLKSNGEWLLFWKAILCAQPRKEQLVQYVQTEIQEITDKFGKLQTLEFQLNIPFPEINDLIKETTIKQWKQLRKKLDEGKPWPVILLINSWNPYDFVIAIAYEYHEKTNGEISVHLYNSGNPSSVYLLSFRISSGAISMEIIQQDNTTQNVLIKILTIHCCNYQVLKPEVGFFTRIWRGNYLYQQYWLHKRRKK